MSKINAFIMIIIMVFVENEFYISFIKKEEI